MTQRDERIPAPVITIDVEAIDVALKEIEARRDDGHAQDCRSGYGCLRPFQGPGGQRAGSVGDHFLIGRPAGRTGCLSLGTSDIGKQKNSRVSFGRWCGRMRNKGNVPGRTE